MHYHFDHRDFHSEMRRAAHAPRQPLPVPEAPSPVVEPPPSFIFPRDDSSAAATSTCTDTTSPGCVLPEATTVPTGTIIALAVVIPLVAAIVVLFFLHRRTTKKQAAEDASYADKDLDYGMDPSFAPGVKGKKGKPGQPGQPGQPEMADMSLVHELRKGSGGRGMSMDLSNPYILPAEVNGSSDSLHSLSRSLADRADPYRMASQTPSIRSGRFGDARSTRSESQRNLLADPSPNPTSRSQSPLVSQQAHPAIQRKEVPTDASAPFNFEDESKDQRSVNTAAANRLSDPNKSLPATPQGDGLLTPPPRGDSKSPHAATNNDGPVDPYHFQEIVVPPSPDADSRRISDAKVPEIGITAETFEYPPPPEPETNSNRMTLGLGLNMPNNRLSVMRPLPPDDPEENPEQRANRIRSFYKEYFSDNDARVHQPDTANYYEDYGDEYLADGTVFDPDSGQFIVAGAPYAEPVTRRAMTPPPRGPPAKFRGGPRRPGHSSQMSSPGVGGPRGRAFSNASTSQMGPGPRGRPAKRPLPPPSALKNLPAASLLKEDAFGFTSDFAPPITYRDRAAGRPESPYIGDRPFSPQVPIAGSPLASAFTELSVMPSPYALRKSGTFTNLDFAPPPKIRDRDGAGSDAGSIRSGRSNFSAMSARQQHAVKTGAYRLSRVPKNLVGTRDDLASTLKPQWNMGSQTSSTPT